MGKGLWQQAARATSRACDRLDIFPAGQFAPAEDGAAFGAAVGGVADVVAAGGAGEIGVMAVEVVDAVPEGDDGTANPIAHDANDHQEAPEQENLRPKFGHV